MIVTIVPITTLVTRVPTMSIKAILREIAFMAIAAAVLIYAAVGSDGVAPVATVVLVSIFAGFGSCWRVTHLV